jgi:hypothetical protein
MQNQVVFEVGEIYANRNGRYRVEELQAGAHVMRILYLDSGEEQMTPIALQQRISRNMNWERQDARHRAKLEERRYLRSYGKDFKGLDADEFKREIVGTRWRRRSELPGMVARKLSVAQREFTFTSWAVARRPVAYLIHREEYDEGSADAPENNARFTIELDEANLYYGLVVERSGAAMSDEWDWPRFIAALRDDETVREGIDIAAETYGAKVIGRVLGDNEDYYYGDTGDAIEMMWSRDEAAGMSINDQLTAIGEVPDSTRAEVFIMVRQPKAEAVSAGARIADRITGLMSALLPVYAAAVK